MEQKKGRRWLFIHKLETLKDVGDTIKLNLDIQKNTIHCSVYRYKKDKKINPNGREYSVRPLGCNDYLFTLVRKGSQ